MNNEYHFSDEHLNAYIDKELDTEEAGQVLRELHRKPELRQQVCEVRQVQDLVRHAYGVTALSESKSTKNHRQWPRYVRSAAALLLLAVGVTIGWLARAPETISSPSLIAAQSRQQNVILHISTDDPIKVSDALDQAELLLARNKDNGQPFRLEIVANNEGLNLLRTRYSSYPERTEELIHRYDNLAVMACARTLQAIKDKGGDIELLPNISTTESALERVVDRLQDGWVYIRV